VRHFFQVNCCGPPDRLPLLSSLTHSLTHSLAPSLAPSPTRASIHKHTHRTGYIRFILYLIVAERLLQLRPLETVEKDDEVDEDTGDDDDPSVLPSMARRFFDSTTGRYTFPSYTMQVSEKNKLGGFVEDVHPPRNQAKLWADLLALGMCAGEVGVFIHSLDVCSPLQTHNDSHGAFIQVLSSAKVFAEAQPQQHCTCPEFSSWHLEKDCETSVYTTSARFVANVMVWKCNTSKCRREWTGLGDFLHRHSRAVAISTEVCK
jgi:hypothetical protein